jgi:hypothetical protein
VSRQSIKTHFSLAEKCVFQESRPKAVSDTGAGDSVHLRGLTIEGLGTGSSGILFNTGGNLTIENCVVRGFTIAGINISPSTSSSFSVSNTIASNNSSPGSGIYVEPTGSAVVTGVLSKGITNNNLEGIVVDGRSGALNVTIVDSEVSNNVNVGVQALGNPNSSVANTVMLRNVVASGNKFSGLFADDRAILRVAHSVVTGNNIGVNNNNGLPTGIINSYGDNDIDGNTNNNTGVLTSLAMH